MNRVRFRTLFIPHTKYVCVRRPPPDPRNVPEAVVHFVSETFSDETGFEMGAAYESSAGHMRVRPTWEIFTVVFLIALLSFRAALRDVCVCLT